MPISPAEEKDLEFAKERPLVAHGLAPVLSTAASSVGTLALLKSKNPAMAAGMMPAMAGAYFMGKRVEEIERAQAGVHQAVPVNPAFAIGGAMLPLIAAGANAAIRGGTPEQKIMAFLKHAPHAITGAAIGRSVALAGAYKNLAKKRLESGQAEQPWDEHSKVANGPLFDFITELPTPGGKFPVGDVEMEYMLQHPVSTTFKPYQLGGMAAGAAIAKKMGGHPVAGGAFGYAAGSLPEAAQRYKHLLGIKKKTEQYLEASRG